MFIKNKKTGLVQECSNKDVIKICQKDVECYDVTSENPIIMGIENIKEAEDPQTSDQPETPAGSQKNLEDMTVPELKALAKDKGIEGASSLGKEDLLSVLKEVM